MLSKILTITYQTLYIIVVLFLVIALFIMVLFNTSPANPEKQAISSLPRQRRIRVTMTTARAQPFSAPASLGKEKNP